MQTWSARLNLKISLLQVVVVYGWFEKVRVSVSIIDLNDVFTCVNYQTVEAALVIQDANSTQCHNVQAKQAVLAKCLSCCSHIAVGATLVWTQWEADQCRVEGLSTAFLELETSSKKRQTMYAQLISRLALICLWELVLPLPLALRLFSEFLLQHIPNNAQN